MQQPQADEHVFLIGRPPLAEFIGFILMQSVEGQNADRRVLADEWRAANDHIRDLEVHEVGWADNPPIDAVPTHLEPLTAQALADPIFQRSFGIVPFDIRMIELDRLVVYQKSINLDYVRRLQNEVGNAPSDEAIFQLCIPLDHPLPITQWRRVAFNAFVCVSPSTDLRFLEPVYLDAGQIIGYNPPGPISNVVGLVVGFGSNCLNVIHAENRLILNNGSHRAYALRELGITHVPCLIQHVTRREELEAISTPEVQQKPDLFLTAPRPPLLKDYFDPKLRKLVRVPRVNRQVKISFGIETSDAPAM